MKSLFALPLVLLMSLAQAAVLDRPLENFARIDSSVPFDVVWQAGPHARLHAEGDQELLEHLQIENSAGVLKLSTRKSWLSWSVGSRKLTISVSSPTLVDVRLTGSGDLKVQGVRGAEFSVALRGSGNVVLNDVQAGVLNAELAGSGDLSAVGVVDGLSARLKGSGDIRFADLKAKVAGANLAGSGDVRLWASEKVILRCGGSGDITVGGSPRVRDVSRHGSCDIHYQ
ncbi:head GIN domain-containing protein [Niveibacterium terrae]|uniref:head GIN domain-containing protein n=1 Tax=Niveibacterium terrae TaxID=3373598 RepID=UPI003A918227